MKTFNIGGSEVMVFGGEDEFLITVATNDPQASYRRLARNEGMDPYSNPDIIPNSIVVSFP